MPADFSSLKKAALINSLRSCKIFAGLPADDLDIVVGIANPRSLEKGEYLFREGDQSRGFYIVQQGAINVHRVNAAGKEQVIHVFRDGTSFAEASLATDKGYPGDARAVEPSTVLLIQKSGFVDLLKRRPELALRMLAAMSLHLHDLVGQLEDMTMKDVETRLANWLVKQCDDPESEQPVTIQLNVTKRVLAAELGTVSETFSRTLAKFRDQGLIEVQGKMFVLTSPVKMLAVLQRHLSG